MEIEVASTASSFLGNYSCFSVNKIIGKPIEFLGVSIVEAEKNSSEPTFCRLLEF